MERRDFLALLGTTACAEWARLMGLQTTPQYSKADVTIHISPVEFEVAPGKLVKTTGYNGSAPGPVLRLRENQPLTVEVFNDTKNPELVHWHGLFVPSEVDGSEEEEHQWCLQGECGGTRLSLVRQAPAGITATLTPAAI